MKNIKKIFIQDIQVGSLTHSFVKYDSEFIILLPHTVITESILNIFAQTHLNAIISDQPLSVEDNDKKDLADENEITNTDANDTSEKKRNTNDSTIELNENSELLKNLEQNDPYLIARTYKEYNILYETAYRLLINFHETDLSFYKNIQEFVCNEIIPRVKKCPYPYLAIGNMPSDVSRDKISEVAFKYLLLTLAVFEQDTPKQIFFRSIDKRIEIAICAFVSYISAINLEKQINRTINFTNPKARDILIKISAQTLYKRHFPRYIVDVIKNIKPYQAQATQYKQTNNEASVVGNFLTIIDYYIQSITLKQQTPFQTLKTIIGDKYNFDAENIRLFAKSIGIIPIGSKVKLRNQSYGIISHFSTKTPHTPEVHLVIDQKGNPRKSFISIETHKREYNVIEIPSYEIGLQITQTYLDMLKSKYQ